MEIVQDVTGVDVSYGPEIVPASSASLPVTATRYTTAAFAPRDTLCITHYPKCESTPGETEVVMLVTLLVAMLPVQHVPGKPLKLVDSATEERLRASLPPTKDPVLLSLYGRPLTFYTDKEMPRLYQDAGGVFTANNNVSALAVSRGGYERFGNANVEFPWGHPAGTHRSPGVTSFKFVYLPAPIRYRRQTLLRPVYPREERVYTWEYPDGTVFGEVLQLPDPRGTPRVFELRTRRLVLGRKDHVADVYRPLLTRKELVDYLTRRHPDFELPGHRVTEGRLRSPHPDFTVVDRTALVDDLPELPEAAVRGILSLPFRSALGQEWIAQGEGRARIEGHAPTTKAAFSFIPTHYDGAYLRADSRSCMTCHEGVNRHASEFEMRRDWYGRVRGSSGIFSFTIFEPSSANSFDGAPRQPRLRRALVDSGWLVPRSDDR